MVAASEVTLGREGSSARCPVVASAGGADLGVGDIDDPVDDPLARAALCDLTICSTTGEPLLDTLINPPWPELAATHLATHDVTVRQVRAAPAFHEIRSTVAKMLKGRRVVCLDRARTDRDLGRNA
ncbi:hypothetical protein ACTWPT_55415 [Nonomuraea sp. 3N208]|uniref:hypothetical protein n=1 Tax=Nonomuraea sp. 3N208 TaxID=3457421 RepID=UPI003FD47DD8